MIRRINVLADALELVKNTYLSVIKNEDSLEGREYFLNNYLFDDETILSFNEGKMKIFGYYVNNDLAGIISIDDNYYIKFLFVDKNYLKCGIGKKLLDYIINNTESNTFTCDSSIYARNFYLKYGFVQISDICESHGMKYIKMEYKKSC